MPKCTSPRLCRQYPYHIPSCQLYSREDARKRAEMWNKEAKAWATQELKRGWHSDAARKDNDY